MYLKANIYLLSKNPDVICVWVERYLVQLRMAIWHIVLRVLIALPRGTPQPAPRPMFLLPQLY
jgi:hypothetical protein